MIAGNRFRWTALALVAGLSVSATAWQLRSAGFGETANGNRVAAPNEGDRRHEILRHLTEVYVSRGAGVSPQMRGGLELAPATFLNLELERQGAKWRVRPAAGSDIEFFEIS